MDSGGIQISVLYTTVIILLMTGTVAAQNESHFSILGEGLTNPGGSCVCYAQHHLQSLSLLGRHHAGFLSIEEK